MEHSPFLAYTWHVLEMLIVNLFKIEKQDMIKIYPISIAHKQNSALDSQIFKSSRLNKIKK